MKKAWLDILVLLAVQILFLASTHAADAGSSRIEEERLKQENIFHSKEKAPEGYTIDRSLADYAQALPAEFESTLAKLGPKDRWMDIGAGRGQAILDYFAPGYNLSHPEGLERRARKAQAIAISMEDRRTPLWHKTAAGLERNQMKYLFDKRFRDYSLAELGRFQVITDLLGGFSYTEDISVFMEKALNFLELNGTFYTLLQDVKSEGGNNLPYYANSPYLTEITDAGGAEIRVCPWLKSITCVEVRCELKPDWKPPIEVYRIQKVCESVTVPPLVSIHFAAGTPPERRYRLKR